MYATPILSMDDEDKRLIAVFGIATIIFSILEY